MPRQVRIEFAGAFYHVMARGDRGEPIYRDDHDRRAFLDLLGEACGKTGWRVHAYALLGNHYHLVIETPEPNLVAGMTWVQATYTVRFNTRHRQRGHVFGGRYKAVLVQREGGDYFRSLLDYVHLNPFRAGLVDLERGLESYPWTSLAYYLAPTAKRASWQAVAAGLGCLDLPDSAAGRRKFLALLEERATSGDPRKAGVALLEGQTLQSTLRRGWYFGSSDFAERVQTLGEVELVEKVGNPGYRGPEMKDHGLRRAEQLLASGLRCCGLVGEDLSVLPKSDPRKAVIALVLKRETPIRLAWISQRLHMGATAGVSRYTSRLAARLAHEPGMARLYRRIVESVGSGVGWGAGPLTANSRADPGGERW